MKLGLTVSIFTVIFSLSAFAQDQSRECVVIDEAANMTVPLVVDEAEMNRMAELFAKQGAKYTGMHLKAEYKNMEFRASSTGPTKAFEVLGLSIKQNGKRLAYAYGHRLHVYPHGSDTEVKLLCF